MRATLSLALPDSSHLQTCGSCRISGSRDLRGSLRRLHPHARSPPRARVLLDRHPSLLAEATGQGGAVRLLRARGVRPDVARHLRCGKNEPYMGRISRVPHPTWTFLPASALFCLPRRTVRPALDSLGAALALLLPALDVLFPESYLVDTPQSINILVFLGIWVGALLAQAHRCRRVSGPVQRQQTKWVVFGFGVLVVLLVGFLLPFAVVPSLSQPGRPYHRRLVRVPTHALEHRHSYTAPPVIGYRPDHQLRPCVWVPHGGVGASLRRRRGSAGEDLPRPKRPGFHPDHSWIYPGHCRSVFSAAKAHPDLGRPALLPQEV